MTSLDKGQDSTLLRRSAACVRIVAACVLHAGSYFFVTMAVSLFRFGKAFPEPGSPALSSGEDRFLTLAFPYVAWLLGGIIVWLVSGLKKEILVPVFAGTFAALYLVPRWLTPLLATGGAMWLNLLPLLVLSTLPVLLSFSRLRHERWFGIALSVLAVVGLVVFIVFPEYPSWPRAFVR